MGSGITKPIMSSQLDKQTEPTIDGRWREVEEEFGEFYLKLTDQRLWRDGKPVVDGVMYVTVYNAILSFFKSKFSLLEEERR